jgi:hypothetical protein
MAMFHVDDWLTLSQIDSIRLSLQEIAGAEHIIALESDNSFVILSCSRRDSLRGRGQKQTGEKSAGQHRELEIEMRRLRRDVQMSLVKNRISGQRSQGPFYVFLHRRPRRHLVVRGERIL